MNVETVKTTMVEIPKGCNIVVEWERNAKVRKGIADQITKAVRMVGRIGIQYDNLKAVQEKRENGELPKENQGLPWGQFEIYPYLIEHKGERYLRLYKGTSNLICPKVAWLKNGIEVAKESIADSLLKSELDSKEGDCFCVNVNSITRLHNEEEAENVTEQVKILKTAVPTEVPQSV